MPDPTNAARQRRWRERQAGQGAYPGDHSIALITH